ncbi:MAG: sugar nucleotide-binding protein, partial [Chloroflexota bacterium]|nr:sugar nucleotide-binding protein [Chloroflexota bacterium]
MKIAVNGAKGMLGSELCRVLGAQHEMLAWDINEIDITERTNTLNRLHEAHPDLIINSAALV